MSNKMGSSASKPASPSSGDGGVPIDPALQVPSSTGDNNNNAINDDNMPIDPRLLTLCGLDPATTSTSSITAGVVSVPAASTTTTAPTTAPLYPGHSVLPGILSQSHANRPRAASPNYWFMHLHPRCHARGTGITSKPPRGVMPQQGGRAARRLLGYVDGVLVEEIVERDVEREAAKAEKAEKAEKDGKDGKDGKEKAEKVEKAEKDGGKGAGKDGGAKDDGEGGKEEHEGEGEGEGAGDDGEEDLFWTKERLERKHVMENVAFKGAMVWGN